MKETTPNGRKRLTQERVINRIKWVKALLSGDYKQGDGQLRNDNFYAYDSEEGPCTAWCCLGVAGHCVKPDASFVSQGSPDGYLPDRFAFDNFGMTGGEDTFGDQDVAVGWNDRECFNFAQIADRVALATEKSQHFEAVTNAPELKHKEPGDYAREWLSLQES